MRKFYQIDKENNHPALEMIDFQNDSYARDIEILFSEIISKVKKGSSLYKKLNNDHLIKEIVDKTFKRTGIKVKLTTDKGVASVFPLYPNKNSIFIPKLYHGEINDRGQNKVINSLTEITGTVDVHKAKVSGVFSEYTVSIYLNIKLLVSNGLNAGELTAIYLHELGHAFHSCEYANRLNTTNQVLAQLLRDKLKNNNISKEYVIKTLKKINPSAIEQDIAKLIEGDNVIINGKFMTFLKETVESLMPDKRYDENSFETVADSFASRWGYGKELVTALHVFEKNQYKLDILTDIFSIGSIALIGYLLYIIIVSTVPIVTIVYTTIMAFIYLTSIIISHSSYAFEMTYDDIKYRYKRVRNQYVELLKDQELSKEQIKQVIEEIKFMDEIIKDMYSYKSVVTSIVDFFTPGNRASKDSINFQRLLEELSANDLYLKSASLRVV